MGEWRIEDKGQTIRKLIGGGGGEGGRREKYKKNIRAREN